MHVSMPIVPAPSTTTVPGSASGLRRNAWTQVATRLGQHRDVGVQLVVDHVDAGHRHRDELAEAAGAAPADELAMLADVLRPGAAGEARSARDLRVHRHAAADERLGPRRAAATTSPTSS